MRAALRQLASARSARDVAGANREIARILADLRPKGPPLSGRRVLTERQRRFVEAYLANPNAARAARIAGYTGQGNTLEVTGSRLLRNAQVRRAIEERTERDSRVMTREERQRWWTAVARGRDPNGGATPPDWKARLRATELLAKSHADFLKRVELSVPRRDLSGLSEAELAELERQVGHAEEMAPPPAAPATDDGSPAA